jgi:phenylacetate-CoA ligase
VTFLVPTSSDKIIKSPIHSLTSSCDGEPAIGALTIVAKTKVRDQLRVFYAWPQLQVRGVGAYLSTLKLLKESQYWDQDRIDEFQVAQLRAMLQHCAVHVPYYRKLFREIGFDPQSVRRTSDLASLPTLDKDTILANMQDLLADNIPQSQWSYTSTGGTTGKQLGLYALRGDSWRERAFIETLWSRVGFHPTRLRANLRGVAVKSKSHSNYDLRSHALVFSNYHMTPETAATYAETIRRRRIAFFHAYPSSALEFARLLKEAGVAAPRFEALLLGSEGFYPGQREAIESFYQTRIYSWYGHSENVALAGECEVSHNYHVFPEYGFVEIIKEDGRPATEEGETGEIVGTSLHNRVMPLIRYRSGDWATIGPKSCPCGRKYRLLKETCGRLQEVMIGRLNNRISMTALNMHNAIFDNVQQFQFHQKEKGKVELRMIPKPSYCAQDTAAIVAAFKEKMGDTMDLELTFVNELPLTERGKFRFIVQNLVPAPEKETEHAC